MPQNIKLMPDYECYSIWDMDNLENIDPQTLPISKELKIKIDKWENRYEETLNRDDPASSGFRSEKEKKAFDSEGRIILKKLRKELGTDYKVTLFSVAENRLTDD